MSALRLVVPSWEEAPPPTDDDFRQSLAPDFAARTKPNTREDPLAGLAGMTNDDGASCREFLGTDTHAQGDGGTRRGAKARPEGAQGADQGGSDSGGRDQPNDDPFDLVALADLPDITLLPEDRLWWDAVLVGHVTVIGGQSNVGKTTLVRNIVAAISTGGMFLGWSGPTGGVPVVVFDYETPGIDRKPRWRAVYGDEIAKIRNVVVSRRTPFLNQLSVDEVCALLRKHNAKVLVVDTLARAFAVESENSNAEMGRMMGLLKQIADTGVAVIVVAHYGKSGTTGIHALRGASSIAAATDILVGFRRERADGDSGEEAGLDDGADGEEAAYILEIVKNRTAGQSAMRVFRTDDWGFRVAPGGENADTRAHSIRVVDAVVLAAGGTGIRTANVVAVAKERGIAKRTVHEALSALLNEGKLRQPKRGLYVHDEAPTEEA